MIIGMAGPARSGKDTAAEILVSKFNFGAIGFADPIKRMIATMLGETTEWIENPAIKDTVLPNIRFSPRFLMQTIGTEWGRETLDKDVWVRVAMRSMDKILNLYHRKGVVFTDVRFENEATQIRNIGGVICHITRPGQDYVHAHASEIGIKFQPSDFKLNNSRTIDYLHGQVEAVIESYDRLIAMRRRD